MFLTIVFGALATLFIWDYVHKRSRVQTLAKSGIPGPKTVPVLGTLEALNVGAENLIQYVGSCFENHGKTFRLWILNEAQIFTMDVKYFESLLNSNTVLQKGDLYTFLRQWLNDGLLVSVGKKWHSRRKVFTPAFHFKVLDSFVDIFDEQSGVMAKRMAPFADGKTIIDMTQHVCLAALDVITEAAMGVKVNAQSDPEFPYVKALKSVVYVLAERMFKVNQRFDFVFKLTDPSGYNKLQKDIKIMHDFTIGVIEERRKALQKSIADGSYQPLNISDDDVGRKQQMALLDILLQSHIDGKPLTNEDIREEVDTFMFEGDDTTTSGVSHALYCIARHPEVQQKLFSEILQVIGSDKDAPVSMRQLTDLKYLECVIKETIRLHPPVPAIGRKSDRDFEIDGKVIPANTSVYLVMYYSQRDPDFFPDPEAFKPERFDDAATENANGGVKRNTFAYTPFSAGPKNCIGQRFAILEMKALVSKMLRYYEILPLGPNVKPMVNLILRSSTGICVGLRPRDYSK